MQKTSFETVWGGGIQHWLYLLGTPGIPLFLAVNGFLLYERDITPEYVGKKLIRYLKFVLLWSVIIGLLEPLYTRKFNFLGTLWGSMVGEGRLSHFWFIAALIVNLILCCAINCLLKRKATQIQHFAGKSMMTVIAVMLLIYFVLDIALSITKSITLREMIIGPLSIPVTSGYFLIGMSMHKVNPPSKLLCACAVAAGYLGICILAQFIPLSWASSYYASPFCVMSIVGIMSLCLNWKPGNRLLYRIASELSPTSIGIWVLHPFFISIIHKAFAFAGLEYSLAWRVLSIPFIVFTCVFLTKIAMREKGLRWMFQI